MNIKEAKKKKCPLAFNAPLREGEPLVQCLGDRCAAWIWDQIPDGTYSEGWINWEASTTDGHCGMMPGRITVDASHD